MPQNMSARSCSGRFDALDIVPNGDIGDCATGMFDGDVEGRLAQAVAAIEPIRMPSVKIMNLYYASDAPSGLFFDRSSFSGHCRARPAWWRYDEKWFTARRYHDGLPPMRFSLNKRENDLR